MTLVSCKLQVVPDIDDEEHSPKKDKGPANSPTRRPSDLEITLHHLHACNTPEGKVPPTKGVPRRRLPSNLPPIRHLSQDAQPLTPVEILAHRGLLVQPRH